MPLFFFDFRDEDGSWQDEIGLDFENLTRARREALVALSEMVGENMDEDGSRFVAIDIRGRIGGPVLCSVATAADEMLVPSDEPPQRMIALAH